ncbi:BRICHOS domain containing protein 5 [Dissostichus eleginoides]|uniref:BRICHOS domain containing protein 5 n=1 Tax=Dissostichus eleginoides TaxID=100907 RepID=A0AAD9BC83_DISEL|nr:BRICHOS domain containing protein 5 [Dissostichus eleginoides]
MLRCWKHSENRLEDAECTDGGSAASPQSHFPHKAFWVSFSASLLLVIIALALTGHLGLSQPPAESLQLVRITAPDQTGLLINQSAVVDLQNDLVTFSITSPANQTSTVLFDIKHGLICYKPMDQESCFCERWRNLTIKTCTPSSRSLHISRVRSSCPGMRPRGRGSSWGCWQAVRWTCPRWRSLCRLCVSTAPYTGPGGSTSPMSLSGFRPGESRLVYFCIDICFPSNICVSVCFYYLPE